jgi:hypothetical protein
MPPSLRRSPSLLLASIYFQFDPTADGRRLKFLNVIGEQSRLCLTIRVDEAAMPRSWCLCCWSRAAYPAAFSSGAGPAAAQVHTV